MNVGTSSEHHSCKKHRFWMVMVLMVVSFGLSGCRHTGQKVTAGASPLNESAVRFAAYMILDDIEAGPKGEQNVLGNKPQVLKDWVSIDGSVTAHEYEAAYDDNEISADNQYKGKRLLVSGTVVKIQKDFSGEGNIWLSGSGLLGIQAALNAQGTQSAAIFTRGQKVDLVCRGEGQIMTIATLGDCEPLSDYLTATTPLVQFRIRSFLEGHAALPTDTAKVIAMMYAIGTMLPGDSPCIRRDLSACLAEMDRFVKDPSIQGAIKTKAQTILRSVPKA